jgi:ribonuclease-3
MQDFSKLEKRLNLKFKNKDLLVQAFCHRSYLNENPKFHLDNNERLEFLGDAVLELIVTEYLYEKYHEIGRGADQLAGGLVNAKMLAEVAGEIDLTAIYCFPGAKARNWARQGNILANTFSADRIGLS